jgi:anti-sigma factor RsiW
MSAMDCQDVASRLSAFHDGELAVSETREVRAHLAMCDACAARSVSLRMMGDALRAAAGPEARRLEPRLNGLSARVVSRVSAERRESFGARVTRLFEDAHLAWAGLSATAALCVAIFIAASTSSALRTGRNDYPAVPSTELQLPTVPSVSVMPVMLVSMPDDSTDLELALSGVVTREGALMAPELVGAPPEHATLVRALMEQAGHTRFAPASRNGRPIAVSVIWLLSRTTVRPTQTVVNGASTSAPISLQGA